jgi:hypothetical protein
MPDKRTHRGPHPADAKLFAPAAIESLKLALADFSLLLTKGYDRKVTETIPAVELIGGFLAEIGVTKALWLLDSPVSNSGRLKTLIGELARENDWDWEIKLLISPDAELARTDMVVASSDSAVLDRCKSWVNLARAIIEKRLTEVWFVDLQ